MGTLLAAASAEASPRTRLGITVAVKLDALRGRLTGAPKVYREGQLIAGAAQATSGADGIRTRVEYYRVVPGAKIELGLAVERRVGPDGRLRFIRTDSHQGLHSTQQVLQGSGDSELTVTRHADGTRKRALVTYTSREERGQRVALAVFDHQTSQRRTTRYHADGARTVTLSQVLRTADGLPTEDIIDTRSFARGE